MHGHYFALIGGLLILFNLSFSEAALDNLLRLRSDGVVRRVLDDPRSPSLPPPHTVFFDIVAFQRSFRLPFTRNSRLIRGDQGLVVNFRNGDLVDRLDYQVDVCEHFTHSSDNGSIVAALSDCHDGKFVSGFLATNELRFDISNTNTESGIEEESIFNEKGRPVQVDLVSSLPETKSSLIDPSFFNEMDEVSAKRSPESLGNLTIELALFVDPSASTIFSQVLSSHQELVDTVLAAINQVQALFRLPSLGQSLQLTIATLEIQLRAPLTLQTFGGQQYKFLESFCQYQDSINNPDDNQPDHWDLAVHLTGLDLFSDQGAFNTLGLAHTGGMCSGRFSCLLTEFGTMKKRSSQYPSTGLGASFVLAHEIGHSLGMRHDDHQKRCQKDGYIMSSSRGSSGETSWSECSRTSLRDRLLDSNSLKCIFDNETGLLTSSDEFDGNPGKNIKADEQCRLFLKAFTALAVDNGGQRCQVLLCKQRPTDASIFKAGPALQGTNCGSKRVCFEGQCVIETSWNPEEVNSHPQWSPWESLGACKSACIARSRGFRQLSRSCTLTQTLVKSSQEAEERLSPQTVVETSQCIGENEKLELCDDSQLCFVRRSREEIATRRCQFYQNKILKLQSKSKREESNLVRGLPGQYTRDLPHQSCQIFCQFEGHHPYLRWSPVAYYRLESQAIEAYFPEGTWCHRDTRQIDYYCQNGECQP